jgi:hypothetical protein
MIRRTLPLLLLAAFSCSAAMGQINCLSGPAATKLVCEFPFATGTLSDYTAFNGTSNTSTVTNSAVQAATAINVGVATQLSQLPLASASAGTVVLYKQGVPVTYDNLGPIMTDRAQTVGKHRFFLGASGSQFVFTDIDGQPMSALPFSVYLTAYNPTNSSQILSTTYTTEQTRLQFRMNQFVGVATLGLTDRFDISAIVPYERISIAATTTNSVSYVVDASGNLLSKTSNASIYAPGSANGVGDVEFNAKYELWKGDHGTFSGAMNVRTPTGDDLNLLGSGAWGFNPYLVYSYLAKVSPHAKIGYQWNTQTELNNPTGAGKQALPGGIQFGVGADWAVRRRVTIAADVLGNQYLNTPNDVLQATTVTIPGTNSALKTETASNSTYTITDFSSGLKWNPTRGLVFSCNVLLQMNNNGLRSRPTPSLGISYKF